MPVTKNGSGEIIETPFTDRRDFEETGVVRDDSFAISDDLVRTKQIKFEASAMDPDSSVTIAAGASSGNVTLTLPATSGTLVTAAGEAPAFAIVQTPSGTSPTADSPNDTLTYANGRGIAISSDATTDTVTVASSLVPYQNVRYVDAATGSDSTGNGSQAFPYQTIQAALTSIGSAASQAEYAAAATARYVVKVAPGTYTEDLTVPTRQIIQIDLDSAEIVGNVTQTINGLVHPAAGQKQSKLIIRGTDMRSMYTGSEIPLTGINGNLTVFGNDASSFTHQIHLFQVGVSGNITWDSSGVGGYTGQTFINDGFIIGDLIVTPAKGIAGSLYAANCDTSSSKNLGGVSGAVTLAILRHARFNRAVVASGTGGGRWYNTTFNGSLSHNLTGYAGTVDMDANTWASYNANVSTKGSETVNRIDSAEGVKVTPFGTIAATNVQAALEEVLSEAPGRTDGVIGITIDGGGSAITTGVKGYIEAPFSGTITGWTITADQSGSCVVDVWKDTYANYPPTVADTIAGSEKPTLSSAIKNQDLSLSSWTTSVTKGDVLGFNVDSAATVTRVTVSLRITKSS